MEEKGKEEKGQIGEFNWRELELWNIQHEKNELDSISSNEIEGKEFDSKSNPPLIDFTLVEHKGFCWIFGGYDGFYKLQRNNVFKLDLSTKENFWLQLSKKDPSPSPRISHSFVFPKYN